MSILKPTIDLGDEYSKMREKLEPSLRIWYSSGLNTFTCVIDGRANDGKLYRINQEDIETDAAKDVLIMINPDISTYVHKLQKALIEMKKYIQNNNNIVEFSIEGVGDHVIFEELEATLYVFRAPQ